MDAVHTADCGGLFSGACVVDGTTGEDGERKGQLREELAQKRKAMPQELLDAQGLKVQARFLATPYYANARTVALYAPIRGEVPTRDILAAAIAENKRICYPLSHVHG